MQITSKAATIQIMEAISAEEGLTEKDAIEQRLQQKKFQLAAKRAFDVLASLGLIILFSPVLLLVALIIKLTSKGDVLYSNDRVGLYGKHFRCYKFRSMVSDQSEQNETHKQATEQAQQGVLLKMQDDPRVTWIGKIIRRTSIDELPQLFNVLFGDMSIIGPRPLVPFMLTHLPEFTEIRCLLRPGITGLWQIRDRKNNTSADFMMEHDLEYVMNYSLLLDFKIICGTPMAVIKAEGAY